MALLDDVDHMRESKQASAPAHGDYQRRGAPFGSVSSTRRRPLLPGRTRLATYIKGMEERREWEGAMIRGGIARNGPGDVIDSSHR